MNIEKYRQITQELDKYGAKLVAVSKTKPAEDIQALYNQGQRIFGENKVQEMTAKHEQLPKDIHWHLIGHLQTNKVKYIAPYVSLIHSVDSLKLLQEIDKQAEKNNRTIDCLLQIFIADEETKFGLSKEELHQLLSSAEYQSLQHIRIRGLMGMATNTDDEAKIESEFEGLKQLHAELKAKYFSHTDTFSQLSMGMSSDYHLALKHGATLVRVGSMLFGER
ncbi:MAG: YggS family pyridoxal phosphate-dependent enzyme [Bacteroidetes bacterium]|nr:YggS family pyridoxal phosphate-dependent enzyme [Bacteroidota bacterium]